MMALRKQWVFFFVVSPFDVVDPQSTFMSFSFLLQLIDFDLTSVS
jgi:hypothetical protein